MKKALIRASFAFLLSFSLPAFAAQSKVDLGKPEMIKRMRLVNAVVEIEAIDLAKRRIMVRRADGVHVTVKVDESVKGLDQFKVGDTVKARYYESTSYQLVKVDPKDVQKETLQGSTVTPSEKNPKVKTFKETTIIATIQEIDPEGRYVKLKGPDGEFAVPVKDPNNLKFVKVGDQVKITYAESLAVSLEKSEKK